MKKFYNRRKFKKLLKKEFGDLFDIKQFNLLVVGKNIDRVNTTSRYSEFFKVTGFYAENIYLKHIDTDFHYLCSVFCSSDNYKTSFSLLDSNVIHNCYNGHYIKSMK